MVGTSLRVPAVPPPGDCVVNESINNMTIIIIVGVLLDRHVSY